MHPQRVREGASRAERQDGKWAAEGGVNKRCRYSFFSSFDVRAYVSCRGYEVSCKCMGKPMNQGGTAGIDIDSSLAEVKFCQGRFLFCRNKSVLQK